jgi:hypothetical protein
MDEREIERQVDATVRRAARNWGRPMTEKDRSWLASQWRSFLAGSTRFPRAAAARTDTEEP